MQPEKWVGLREFARQRSVTLAAVQKAIESGRVTAVRRNLKGRLVGIELHQASAQWNNNTDIDQAARAGAPILVSNNSPEKGADLLGQAPGEIAVSAPHEVEVAGERPGTFQAGAPSEDSRYLAARAKKQEFEAQQAELDYLKALGLIVSVEELQRVNARRYAAIRNKLLNIPDRLSTIIAAERDPARVHAAITGEIKRVLNELADDAAAAAAGGPAERVAT